MNQGIGWCCARQFVQGTKLYGPNKGIGVLVLHNVITGQLTELSPHMIYCRLQFISQYMEELMGPILFCWTACGVSLVALVEVM